MQWVGIIPESGEVLMHHSIIICSNEQTRHVNRSRWVWWRTWVVIIICLTKQTLHINRSIWVWWRTWVLCRPSMWVPILASYFYVSQISEALPVQGRIVRILGASHWDNSTKRTCTIKAVAKAFVCQWLFVSDQKKMSQQLMNEKILLTQLLASSWDWRLQTCWCVSLTLPLQHFTSSRKIWRFSN